MRNVPSIDKQTDVILQKGNEQFVVDWLTDNQSLFAECMKSLAIEKPEKFCELYLKANAAAMNVKRLQQHNTVNITVDKDFSKLQQLASINSKENEENYDDYKEVKDVEFDEGSFPKDFSVI